MVSLRTRSGKLFLLVCVAGLALRSFIAVTTTYLWDEDRDWIPLAEQISLNPDSLHLPIRGEFHPAVPAYGIALGRAIVGKNELGSRAVGVLVGTLTIVLLGIAARWFGGDIAMLSTAGLLAFNEYHVQVSALATEKAYYLFFSALALVLVLQFLRETESKFLYTAAAAAALALLSKELALFLVVAIFIGLLVDRPETFRERRLLVAVLIGAVLLLPEIWWNLAPHTARADYAGHLSRFAGIGITVQPLSFYFSSEVAWMMERLGREVVNFAPEYVGMNGLFGLVLVAGVAGLAWDFRKAPRERGLVMLFACFLLPVATLSLMNTREIAGLDGQLPFWSDLSLVAASILAGVWLARRSLPARVAMLLAIAATAWSSWRIVATRVGMPDEQFMASRIILMPPDSTLHDVRVRSNVCYVCSPIVSMTMRDVVVVQGSDTLPASAVAGDIHFGANEARLRAYITGGADRRVYLLRGLAVRANGDTLPWQVGAIVPAGAPPYRPNPVW